MKLVIKGRLPGLNDYISAERSNRHQAAIMHYVSYEKDRRRDKDTIAFAKKFIQDTLVKAGILKNDGWAQIYGFTDAFRVDPENPRVEVEIKEAPREI